MKITDYNATNSNSDRPSDLAAAFIAANDKGDTMVAFLSQFDFDSQDEIRCAVIDLCKAICDDKWLGSKQTQMSIPSMKCLLRRFTDIYSKQAQIDKYPQAISGEMWHGDYASTKREKVVARMFDCERDLIRYKAACARLTACYGMSELDEKKLHFFVCQVRAGREFPDSLRRMLYLWGKTKKTGKTTLAKALVCVLNGSEDMEEYTKFSTTLQTEMQIKNFSVPKIAECRCAMMDECFFADMSKVYADFKKMITGRDGTARLPYGQEFRWQGLPNYISTSNEPLVAFIKDWNDRRYLSINFESEPKETMTDGEVIELVKEYCVNAPDIDFHEWAAELYKKANEKGEKTERAEEFAIEMQKEEFLSYIKNATYIAGNKFAADNRISAKWFVDFFVRSMGAEAHKRRAEILEAARMVFGDKYNDRFWLLDDLRARADELARGDGEDEEDEENNKLEEDNEKLPF